MRPTYHPASKFDALYTRFERMVRCVVSRVLHRHLDSVDDVTQQVWIEASANCDAGKDIGESWLQLRARSRALDVRRELNEGPVSLDAMAELESSSDEDNSLIDKLQFANHIEGHDCRFDPRVREYVASAVDRLPPRTGQVITAFYYASQTIPQIAGDLKISQGTVKWHLNQGRAALREMFFPDANQEAA